MQLHPHAPRDSCTGASVGMGRPCGWKNFSSLIRIVVYCYYGGKILPPQFLQGKKSSEQGGYASARRPQTGQNFCPGGANPAASRKISAESSGPNLYSSKAPASELVVPRRQTHTAEHDAIALTQWPMPSENGKSKSMTVLSPCEHRARTKAHTHTHTPLGLVFLGPAGRRGSLRRGCAHG